MDFVLAYTQADVERDDLYMEISKYVEVDRDKRKYVLHLKKNLYGMRQAGGVWNKDLLNACAT
jgi:hypothetical protein